MTWTLHAILVGDSARRRFKGGPTMTKFALFFICVVSAFAAKPLEVRFIDVEGGQATLVIAPSGESLLIDTGYPERNGRDADRIVAEAKSAGLQKIDYVLITHYHSDHVGGVPQLAARIPIGTFIDHGPNRETSVDAKALWSGYETAFQKAKRLVVKPGDVLPIRGLRVEVVTAAGDAKAVRGAGKANASCASAQKQAEDSSENAWSLGTLITYGKFRMVDLGDLTWNKELELVCPTAKVPNVDVYVTSHHGLAQSGSPQLVAALHPRVAIMNNGARKGGAPAAWQIVCDSPGLEDLWQLHFSVEGGPAHNVPAQRIANPEEACQGKAIALSANDDGSFSVTNLGTGFTKKYGRRGK